MRRLLFTSSQCLLPAMKIPIPFLLVFSIFLLLSACRQKNENALFTPLSATASGIQFSNDLKDSDSADSFINEFGYMGSGVGIGDFNNDGLKDIFFAANQKSCRLYINKGQNKFEDITEQSGVTTNIWATGVSVVDINNDGYDDIYVSAFGKNLVRRCPNLLFINQHDLTFKEEAASYGLADTSFSTQAVFFDYDKDGDLDMYLANYLLGNINTNIIFPRDRTGRSAANDRLYRNDGDSSHAGHPSFTDVTITANIKEDGYGLGVVASDYNNDGWQDIYVANDFLSNDALWLNNRNGTFTNSISRSIQHQSYSSMGADAADLNNDARPDIVTLDMLPESNRRKKTAFFFMNYERYEAERAMGYEPSFMRNMLQINNGSYISGDTSIPFFSEIGQLAGIQATDWSWSVLLADFDNDGWKDMHITNGIGRDFINADWLEFSNKVFSSAQTREEQQKAIRKRLADLKPVDLPNYLYLNQRDYTFADVSEQAGINELSLSNGAAYADLDNDGDLDLVVNNINREAFTFINNTNQPDLKRKHFVTFKLEGSPENRKGFGTKLLLYANGKSQMQEQNPVRGYFSSVDNDLHFGLGDNSRIDSVVVIWPDDKKQLMLNVAADTTHVVSWLQAREKHSYEAPQKPTLFSQVPGTSAISHRHFENPFNDFAIQRLLPQKYSQLGPSIAAGDINRDGITDFFVGNGFNFSGKIFTQQPNGSFADRNLTDSIKLEEDTDCIFFDADGNGSLDLLVLGGDFRYEQDAEFNKPRLYTNDGKGGFTLKLNAIPPDVKTIGGTAVAGDFDGDGDDDIFIGGRVSKRFPEAPRSYLLQNNNGVFRDVTTTACPGIQHAGMITSAVCTDFDNDKQPDLVIAGEWMPIRFFRNNKGLFEEVTALTGLKNTDGMWRALITADIDGDGDQDLVAGNYGLNNTYNVSTKEPMQLFAADIDGNGSIDPVLFYYIKDENGVRRSYPGVSRNLLSDQVPGIKKRFLLYNDYAQATFADIFKGKKKEETLELTCNETRSCFFENLGGGKFQKHILPVEAQFAPVNAIICHDFDNDGYKDLLLAGNEYQTEVVTGRYDASYGCFLKGSKEKRFTAKPAVETGFIIQGDVKDMALIQSASGHKRIIVAVNNDSLRIFQVSK